MWGSMIELMLNTPRDMLPGVMPPGVMYGSSSAPFALGPCHGFPGMNSSMSKTGPDGFGCLASDAAVDEETRSQAPAAAAPLTPSTSPEVFESVAPVDPESARLDVVAATVEEWEGQAGIDHALSARYGGFSDGIPECDFAPVTRSTDDDGRPPLPIASSRGRAVGGG